jgi:hypothetical protein
MTAPFVMVAYLLRGLDIEMVAITFLAVFTAIQVLNGMAIFIFSNVRTKVQMAAVLGGSFFVFIFGFSVLVSFISVYFRFGSGSVRVWTWLAGELLIAGAVLALFLAASIASIAPATSNRLLPLRLTITVIYLGSLLICLTVPSLSFATNTLVPWVYSWTWALTILILMVVSERETWSVRIKRTIPQRLLFRIVLFPFYTGSANGFVWLALMGFGIVLVMAQTGDVYEWCPFYWLLFSFDYCVTAMLLRSRFVSKKITPEKTWIIIAILFLIFVPGGMAISFLFSESPLSLDLLDQYSHSLFSVLNPFLLKESVSDSWTHLLKEPVWDSWTQMLAAQYWGLGLLVPLLIWFLNRARRFSPKEDGETLTLEQAIAAIREADANPLVQSDRERAKKINDLLPVSLPTTQPE